MSFDAGQDPSGHSDADPDAPFFLFNCAVLNLHYCVYGRYRLPIIFIYIIPYHRFSTVLLLPTVPFDFENPSSPHSKNF